MRGKLSDGGDGGGDDVSNANEVVTGGRFVISAVGSWKTPAECRVGNRPGTDEYRRRTGDRATP